MTKEYDLIIIGAGIIGTSIARELSKYKTEILILEKDNDVSMGSSKANSGIVHGGYAEDNSLLKGKLCYEGRKEFKRLNEELNFGFKETGSLVVTREDSKETLERLMENGIKNGLKDLKIIDSEEIRKMEAELNPDLKWALHCKGAGVCSPYEMTIAMAENAIKNGVRLELENQVLSIEKTKSGFKITSNKDEFYCKYLVNASGINADKISKMLGVDNFKIKPKTGEYLLFARGTGNPIKSVIFQPPIKDGKGILVTSTYYGNLLIGPDSNDYEDHKARSTHVSRLGKIYYQANSLYNKIKPQEFIRSFTGVRAKSSTDDFIIEESKIKGFINVAGIQSPGLTSSPAIAKMLVDILKDSGFKLEINPEFDPYRKAIIRKKALKPLKDIKDLVELPLGSKGRVVCRCEQVKEEEIVDALHRGIKLKTVDAVKRRTRASMGFCQGNFCRSRIAEIMKREYGEDIDISEDIEHKGIKRVKKQELIKYLNENTD